MTVVFPAVQENVPVIGGTDEMAALMETVSMAVLKVSDIWLFEVTFCDPPKGVATVTFGTVVVPPNGPTLLLLLLEQFIVTANTRSKLRVTNFCFFKFPHPHCKVAREIPEVQNILDTSLELTSYFPIPTDYKL
jgi:hypothetical protein